MILLRLRALLAQALGGEGSQRDYRDRYRDMAETLGFQGHISGPRRCDDCGWPVGVVTFGRTSSIARRASATAGEVSMSHTEYYASQTAARWHTFVAHPDETVEEGMIAR